MPTETKTGVILDFDGVIADSMPQHLEAYRRVLAPFGVRVAQMDVYRREGARSESIIRTLLGDDPAAKDDQRIIALADEKQGIFASLGDVELYPGAAAFVQEIRETSDRLGLVTGTRKENLQRWAGEILPLFDAVLAQDSYANDKPHPEPYRRAIDRLGVPPERSIVVENAPRGVESAKAAGTGYVVAVTTTLARRDLVEAGADIVVADLEEAAGAVRDRLAWLRDGA